MGDWRDRLVIYEPTGGGHRLTYVRYLLEGLKCRGIRPVVALGPPARADKAHDVQLGPFKSDFDEHALPAIRTSGPRAFADRAKQVAELIRTYKPERVWYPNADGAAQVASVMAKAGLVRFGGCRVTPLVLRGSAAYRTGPRTPRDRLADRVYRGMLKSKLFDRVLLIDRLVDEWCSRQGLGDRVQLIPDPLPPAPSVSPAEAREKLGLEAAGRGFSIAGGLDERKGADRLIRAFIRLRRDGSIGESDRLYMAGRQDDVVRELLRGEAAPLVESGAILVGPGYVSEEEFWLWLAAGDVVVTPYPAHVGPASIAVRAAALGRPVVGGTFGWLGRLIADYDLGIATDTAPEPLAQAMADMLSRAHEWLQPVGARDYVQSQTIDGFVRGFLGEPD